MKTLLFSIDDILTHFFGNKVKVVTVSRLKSFCKLETKVLFDGYESMESIKIGCEGRYIESVKTFRTKEVKSPTTGHYRILEEERATRFYDD